MVVNYKACAKPFRSSAKFASHAAQSSSTEPSFDFGAFRLVLSPVAYTSKPSSESQSGCAAWGSVRTFQAPFEWNGVTFLAD